MKIQVQPDLPCPCGGIARGHGEAGNMDLYHCGDCGLFEWIDREERRGSARKKATDDPIEVTAVSGQIDDYKLAYGHRSDKLTCSECGVESLLMHDTHMPTEGT